MTNEQLCLIIGIPCFVNAICVGACMAYLKMKFDGIHRRFDPIEEHFAKARDLRRIVA